jgi:hypothetical protein
MIGALRFVEAATIYTRDRVSSGSRSSTKPFRKINQATRVTATGKQAACPDIVTDDHGNADSEADDRVD